MVRESHTLRQHQAQTTIACSRGVAPSRWRGFLQTRWLVDDRHGHAMSGLGCQRGRRNEKRFWTTRFTDVAIGPSGDRPHRDASLADLVCRRCSWCSTPSLRPKRVAFVLHTTRSMTAPIPARWRPARPVTEIMRTPRSIPLPRPSWPARNPRRPPNPSGNRARLAAFSRSDAGKAIACSMAIEGRSDWAQVSPRGV